DPERCISQRLRVEGTDPVTAANLLTDKACILKHDNVLRDRVERHREVTGDVSDARRALPKMRKNGAARWIGDSTEHAVERFRGTMNHTVEGTSGRAFGARIKRL